MSSSMSYPASNVRSTGAGNWIEIAKLFRIFLFWMCAIYIPVWLACWGVGELLPFLIFRFFKLTSTTVPIIETLQVITPIVAVLVFVPINAMFMVLFERRALALFTVRKGPNRVGFDGLAQTAADAVKLLFKEDITPRGADAVMFTLAPIIFFAPSVFGAIPLLAAVTNDHPLFVACDLPTGVFFVLAMSSIPVVGLVMGGWASNNKYSLVGGLRSAAQAISYEIPLVLSIITVCFLAGSLDVVKIALQQAGSPAAQSAILQAQSVRPVDVFRLNPDAIPMSAGMLQWNLFGQGALTMTASQFAHAERWNGVHIFASIALVICMFLLMGIYMISATAEISRIPFDLPEAESELVSGYNTEYSGIKFAIFFLAEFTNLYIVSTIATVMFLGGGASPIPGFFDAHMFQQILSAIGNAANISGTPQNLMWIWWILGSMFNAVTISSLFWAIIKVYSFVFFAILVRGTLPRFRIDQLLDFGWKRLIPLTLFLFIAVSFLRELM